MELDEIKTLMPWFLDQQAKSDLYVDVKSLASGEINFSNYFVSSYGSMANEVSQGDILKEMPVISLPSVRVKNGLCMIISNSCHISKDSKKVLTPRLIYAPVAVMSKFEKLLKEAKKENKALIEDIKKQRVMDYFYLPKNQYNDQERIVLFDNMLSIDHSFINKLKPEDITYVRLGRSAWYHLLIKLTAYFTRITKELVVERPE
jgi:hypothetical protein